MPYYVWFDKNTESKIEVQRTMKDIEIAPDKEECLEQGMEVEDYAEADWERGIEAPPFIGEKNKGYW